MLRLMAALDAVLRAVFDALLRPLAPLPPLASLAIVSLVAAAAMLLVVRRTSDQPALDTVKRRIYAALFEIRLFNDDLRAIFRAQGEMLRHNLTYLRLSLAPMLWMLVPFVLVIAQLQFHYGYDGLRIGEPALLTARMRAQGGGQATLEAPPQLHVQTNAVWFPATQEAIWRLTPTEAGEYEVRVRAGSETYAKTISVSDGIARRSPERLEAGLVNQLLYPAEPPLPADAAVTSIAIAYPSRDIDVLGWKMNWLVVFFGLSIVFALVLKRPFGVTL